MSPYFVEYASSRECAHTVCDPCLHELGLDLFVANVARVCKAESQLQSAVDPLSRSCPHKMCVADWTEFYHQCMYVPRPSEKGAEDWDAYMSFCIPSSILRGDMRSPDPERPELKGWEVYGWTGPVTMRLFGMVYEAADDLLWRSGGSAGMYRVSKFGTLGRNVSYLVRSKRETGTRQK